MSIRLDEYVALDATDMAELVQSGQTSAAELCALALAQAERVNPRINAVTVWLHEQAQEQINAHRPGPLAGVPVLIKDLVQDFAGVATSQGSRAMLRRVPSRHSAFVDALLGAGAIILGKTNTPELGLKAVTDPRAFGITRNPWNLEHVPGGSSGGSAAAVAAAIVPMAGANDGGGSIRIPAACCGLFGLKPSRGRVSVGPAHGESWDGASADMMLTRSVRDAALALDIVSAKRPGEPFRIVETGQSFVDLACHDPGRLRIGVSTLSPLGTPVHPKTIDAVHETAHLLGRLGHHVEQAAPVYDGNDLASCYLNMYFGQVAATMAEARTFGAHPGEFELLTRVLGVLGRASSAGDYVAARRRWNGFARALGDFHTRYDLYLTPSMATPPIRHGQADPGPWQKTLLAMLLHSGALAGLARLGLMDGVVEQLAREMLQLVPFTQLANLTGVPAMSLPLHWSDDGLPLGIHVSGPFASEARLLQLATQLEREVPWMHRLPLIALPTQQD